MRDGRFAIVQILDVTKGAEREGAFFLIPLVSLRQ
jgi:hypothetical protein